MGTRRTCLAQHCDTSPRTSQTPPRLSAMAKRLITMAWRAHTVFVRTIIPNPKATEEHFGEEADEA
jgi:hypothetical protein